MCFGGRITKENTSELGRSLETAHFLYNGIVEQLAAQWTVNPPPSGIVGSNPAYPTIKKIIYIGHSYIG